MSDIMKKSFSLGAFRRSDKYIRRGNRHITVKNPLEESPGEQGIYRNGISYGDGTGVFEIPGKWRCENGSRLLRGAFSLVRFFGHAKK